MKKCFCFLIFLLCSLLLIPAYADTTSLNGSSVSANETNPNIILEKSKEVYRSLKTYKTRGTVVSDMINSKEATNFNILLKKPNLYLITWEVSSNCSGCAPHSTGAVWNDGTGPYLFDNVEHGVEGIGHYSKKKSDDIAISNATGISNSAALTLPTTFLSIFTMQKPIFDRIIDPTLEGMEKVDNDDCYVISGSSQTSKKVTIWISKSTYLLRKYSRSFEPPIGMKMPEMTDEQIDNIIKAEGLKVTAELRQEKREAFKKLPSNVKGENVETFMDISSPEIINEEFKFQLPEGSIQKHDSYLGDI